MRLRDIGMAWLWPPAAVLFYVAASAMGAGGTDLSSPIAVGFAVAAVPVLLGAVFAAVFHSEVIAHRTGEPYGTLVLTVSVIIIEVALIMAIMASGKGNPALARDSIFAVVMIVCNGMVGLCIVIGGLKYREQSFRVTGASAYLTVLMPLAVLTLVLPNFTITTPGPVYSREQLVFVSLVTLALYAVFLYMQTILHRDYFLIEGAEDEAGGEVHAHPAVPIWANVAFLLLSLVSVVLLAKKFAGVLEAGLEEIGAPEAVAGVLVALLVLLPEAVAAVAAARRDQLQKSINLALGSSLATIGLTMPAIAALAILQDQPILLGVGGEQTILLALTFAVSLLTFATGRTNILSGFVHLVLFATFALLVFAP
jgi:Ca2+:H+ antiporter